MRSTAAKFPDYFAVRLAAGDRWVIEVPDDAAVALAHYCCAGRPYSSLQRKEVAAAAAPFT